MNRLTPVVVALCIAGLSGSASAQQVSNNTVVSSIVNTNPGTGAVTPVTIIPNSYPANHKTIWNQQEFANTGDPTRPDDVMAIGYNMTAGGNRLNTGDHAGGYVFESYYSPGSPTLSQSEQYFQYIADDGTAIRPIAVAYKNASNNASITLQYNSMNWQTIDSATTYLTCNTGNCHWTIPLQSDGNIHGGALQSDGNTTAGGNISATSTTLGYIYSANIAIPGFILNGGTNYGIIQDVDSAHTWSLGYGSSKTNPSTAVLSWTDNAGVYVGAPTGSGKGTGTLNVAGAYYANGTVGVTCSGTPTSSFASVNGIVTHC